MSAAYKVVLLFAAALCVGLLVLFTGGNSEPARSAADGAEDPPAALTAPAPKPPARPSTNNIDNLRRLVSEANGKPAPAADATVEKPTARVALGPAPPTATGSVVEHESPAAGGPAAASPAAQPPEKTTTIARGQSPGAIPGASPGPAASGERTIAAPPAPASRVRAPKRGAYVIAAGDTFSSIAQELYDDADRWVEIARANPTVDPLRLRIGQKIRVPDSTPTARPAPNPAPAGRVVYTVGPGDTLSGIARQYYSDPTLWRVLYRANRSIVGVNPNTIRPGSKIVIPPAPRGAE